MVSEEGDLWRIYVRITNKDGECKMTLVWHIHVHVIVMKKVGRGHQ